MPYDTVSFGTAELKALNDAVNILQEMVADRRPQVEMVKVLKQNNNNGSLDNLIKIIEGIGSPDTPKSDTHPLQEYYRNLRNNCNDDD